MQFKTAFAIGIISMMMANGLIGIFSMEEVKGETSSKTIYVDDSGGKNYTKIQDAINNASNGDNVFVYNGTYYENIVINKTINLIGENKNATIIDGSGSGDVVKIKSDNVSINEFTIRNSGYDYNVDSGIKIESKNNKIIGNNLTKNYYGIYIKNSEYNTIKENEIYSNIKFDWDMFGTGIFLTYSNNNNISKNNISENNCGISLSSSNNNEIHNNIIYKNIAGIYGGSGIFIEVSSKNFISYNNLSKNEVGIFHYSSDNNTISKSEFFSNNIGVVFSGVKGSHKNNILDCIITSNARGIDFSDSNENKVINSYISKNDFGIFFTNSSKNQIIRNKIFSNKNEGIRIFSSYDDYEQILYESKENKIINSDIYSNINAGIGIYSSSKNEIINSSIYENYYGIKITYTPDTQPATYNFIDKSNISRNNYGIFLERTYYTTITNSSISLNKNYGVYISTYNDNYIYRNNIVNNSKQAFDDGENYWNKSKIGNYWSDYKGEDKSDDGIGDTPYRINGSNEYQYGEDKYPSMKQIDIRPLSLSIISPINDTVNGTIKIIILATDDDGIKKVEFYIDNVLKFTDVDSLYEYEWITTEYHNGQHEIKIIGYDTMNNSREIKKNITVKNEENKQQISKDNHGETLSIIQSNFILILISLVMAIVLLSFFFMRRNKLKSQEPQQPQYPYQQYQQQPQPQTSQYQPMPQNIVCPNCQSSFQVSSQIRPLQVQCPYCGLKGEIK